MKLNLVQSFLASSFQLPFEPFWAILGLLGYSWPFCSTCVFWDLLANKAKLPNMTETKLEWQQWNDNMETLSSCNKGPPCVLLLFCLTTLFSCLFQRVLNPESAVGGFGPLMQKPKFRGWTHLAPWRWPAQVSKLHKAHPSPLSCWSNNYPRPHYTVVQIQIQVQTQI